MLKTYFKIAWRNLFRNRSFSLINLLGLTIGMTCSILIMLWVYDEWSYDKFHRNYGQIYQVIANRNFNNKVFTDRNMVFPLAKTLEASDPQIKNAVVMSEGEQHIMEYGDIKLNKSGYTVSEHFFDMFTWTFLRGNAASLGFDPSSVVLTESSAKAYFGDADPIGKTLRVDNSFDLKVAAVVADPPGNSTFQFDFIKFFYYDDPNLKNAMGEWGNSSWWVFVQTVPGADAGRLSRFVDRIKHDHSTNDKISAYFAFPMSKWRLYSDFKDGKNVGGMIEYVHLFSYIALIILLIACINFMNLSTARSERRAKEVGIRKTLGSGKRQLRLQFLFESLILSLIAALLSILAVWLLLPAFNSLVDKHLALHPGQGLFWISMLLIVLVTGLIAGSYPAFYLSSFNPVKILKGSFLPGRKAAMPRRVLVVTQFVISILLISATLIVFKELNYIKNRDIGYNPNNLIMMPASGDINAHYAAFRQDLLNSGLIEGVTRSSSPITSIYWHSGNPDYDGMPPGTSVVFAGMLVDKDFSRTFGIRMLEGSDFEGDPSDTAYMLLNKTAVKAMQLKHPLGMVMRNGGKKFVVKGVMDDVVMTSPYDPVEPLMVFSRSLLYNSNAITVRLKNGVLPQTALPVLEKYYKTYNPAFLFEYRFVDKEFAKKFSSEELVNRISQIFAGLAIFICCLGLAGLASFTIEKRIREIGIRKVLGATVRQILQLIASEFVKLVLIAFLIAVPVSWWLMNNWLAKYAFRIDIGPWVFLAVGVFILLLTLFVVSLNAIGAAIRNPVRSLRTE